MAEAAFFPTSAPEAQGIPSDAILAFVEAVERDIRDLHSFILLRHGAVVAEAYWEPFGAAHPHVLFSLSKSFTSTAIGFLVAERRLSVDDRVLDFFPDEAPAQPSERLRALRVRHLLTMTTGHDPDPTGTIRMSGLEPDQPTWTKSFLSQPLVHEPGSHFVYNSLATYMLSAIAQRITGERLIQYLQPRLFAPLGIEGAKWETSPQGIDTGGWGLSVKTRDIARFGQLYLQRGVWEGKRLLNEAWIAEATSGQVPNGPSANPDWEQGYGYQFWRCRHGAYRGDGAFGQYCIVMPDQDAVLAITSGVGNMQAVLDLVWKHLQPAMTSAPLADDAGAQRQLADRLAALRLTPAARGPACPQGPRRARVPAGEAARRARVRPVRKRRRAAVDLVRVRGRRRDARRSRRGGLAEHRLRSRTLGTERDSAARPARSHRPERLAGESGGERRLDGRADLRCRTLVLRDAVPSHAHLPLRRRPPHRRAEDERLVRPDRAAAP